MARVEAGKGGREGKRIVSERYSTQDSVLDKPAQTQSERYLPASPSEHGRAVTVSQGRFGPARMKITEKSTFPPGA